MRRAPAILVALVLRGRRAPPQYAATTPGMSLFGDLKYGPDFKHFDYVNPDAPKGGTMRLSAIGTFDTLNPYVVKGVPAAGIGADLRHPGGGLARTSPAANTASSPKRSSSPPTNLGALQDPQGSAVSRRDADDARGRDLDLRDVAREGPSDRTAPITAMSTKVEKEGERGVRFVFKSAENRELPQILGQMPVLSKAYWSGRDFEKTTLEPPLGSGPYKIEAVDPGRSITYRRVADYWAADLPVMKGRYNVERSATTTTATRRSRSRRSRPASTTSGWRIRRRSGRPGTTARPCAPG